MLLIHLRTLSLKSKIKGLDIENELFWFRAPIKMH